MCGRVESRKRKRNVYVRKEEVNRILNGKGRQGIFKYVCCWCWCCRIFLGSICLLAKLHITYMNTDLILSSLLCRKIAKHAHLPRHPACYLSFSSLADSSSSSNNASIFCKEERPCRLILMTSLRCRSSREIIF